jgi:hypothetical protein
MPGVHVHCTQCTTHTYGTHTYTHKLSHTHYPPHSPSRTASPSPSASTGTYTYTYTYTYAYTHMHIYTYTYAHAHMHIHIYTGIDAVPPVIQNCPTTDITTSLPPGNTRTGVYVYVYVFAHTYIHTHSHTHTHTHTHIHHTAVTWPNLLAIDDKTSQNNLAWASNFDSGELFSAGAYSVVYTVADSFDNQVCMNTHTYIYIYI